MNEMFIPEKKIKFFFILVGFTISILSVRLGYLQLYAWNYFIIKSSKNFLRIKTKKSERGDITDRNGKILATNQSVNDLVWCGTGNKKLTDQQRQLLQSIESITENILNEKMIAQAERTHAKITLLKELSQKDVCSIAEQYPDNPNIVIESRIQRHYPFHTYASHLIGYLGNDIIEQHSGKMGLEKFFEINLRGTDGSYINTINSFGKNIESFELKKTLPGGLIKTTLDIDIQALAESIFPNDLTGALVLFDPIKGDILASLSRPTFDPHIFLKQISHHQWNALQEKSTFLNRILALYPPGSIFKLVTISAARELNIVSPEISWQCKGYSVFCGRKYWCAHKRVHGKISLKEAVAQSCNTLFFEIGKKIDIDVLAHYAHIFGFGEETGFLFKEQKGVVPTRAWKRLIKQEQWWPGETLSVTIGQSFLLTSLLQVVRMIGAIFTGYLVKPRLLLDESIETMPLLIEPETREFLKESMHLVIQKGTGKQLQKIKDLEIYAKTSTAQTSSLEKSFIDNQFKEHGSFVTYFHYKDNNPLVLAILIEKAGSSKVPTIIAKNFIVGYKKLHESGSKDRLNTTK